ncbi:MAG: glycosyltransferase family 4 protein [Nitrospinae bacterium]|nr:glycosyltransferase family 4 protein [Nitrospinota bacterium]
MEKLRVLHFCFSRSWGGLEKNFFDLAVAQHNAGHHVLCACRAGFSLERELKKIGVPCAAFHNVVKYVDLGVILALRRIIKTQNISVAHGTHTEDLGLLVPAVAGLKNVRLFFTLQMNVPEPKKDVYHRWEYGRLTKLFVSSSILKEAAAKNLPISADKIMVVPYGINTDIYRPERDDEWRKSIGLSPETFVLGILARLDPPKGQMEAIQALPQIRQKFPNALLMLVGDESVDHKGAEVKRLRDEVKKLDLEKHVMFVSDKRGAEQAKYLNAMDIFLSPSHYETFSTSMMMAQLCAIPIIGTNVGGTPEQLGWGKYGELVEPMNPASLAEGTIKVMENYPSAKKRAEELRVPAVQQFDMRMIVERVIAEYVR